METLKSIWSRLKAQGYETDKGSIHSYIEVYEKILAPYREAALNVLEIGIFNGHSLRMWAEYFTQAKIHGIDCSLTPHDGMADLRPLINDIKNTETLHDIGIQILDAENATEVNKRYFGAKFDVIIEDAGHDINQQLNLYRIWKEYLQYDGIYITEDVQDIERHGNDFERLGGGIFDLRDVKGRYDDCLIVFRNEDNINYEY